MKHDFLDKYSNLDSPIHRADPRSKIISFFAGILVIVSEPRDEIVSFLLYFTAIFIMIAISRVPLKFMLKRCLIASPFILLAGLLLPISLLLGGEASPQSPSQPIFNLSFSIVLKAYASILLLSLMTSTEKFHRLLAGLRHLKAPNLICTMLALMYRYVFLLIDELHKTDRARKSRTPGDEQTDKIKTFANRASVIFLRSWKRASTVYHAMTSRGFNGKFPEYKDLKLKINDLFFAGLLTLSMLSIRVFV